MSVAEGLRGIRLDAKRRYPNDAKRRLAHTCKLTARAIQEVLRITTSIPYGIRAARLHRAATESGRCIADQRYGTHERQTADVWLPPRDKQAEEREKVGKPPPIVLFVHGGVWSSGDSWHYAPMANALAQRGAVCVVMKYRLYPEVRAEEQVADVCAAVSWVSSSVAPKHCADAANLSLVGHSAGAHLASLALVAKAATMSDDAPKAARRVVEAIGRSALDDMDVARFVALNGVFDIPTHYQYESWRGVEALSTMARAMGGDSHEAMAALSPSRLLRESNDAEPPPGGRNLPHRLGLCAKARNAEHASLAKHLPRTHVFAALGDTTVPWEEQSAAFHHELSRGGAASELLLYPAPLGHGDLALCWPDDAGAPKPWHAAGTMSQAAVRAGLRAEAAHGGEARCDSLPPWAHDLVGVVHGSG